MEAFRASASTVNCKDTSTRSASMAKVGVVFKTPVTPRQLTLVVKYNIPKSRTFRFHPVSQKQTEQDCDGSRSRKSMIKAELPSERVEQFEMAISSWIEDYGSEMFKNFNMSKLGRDEAYLNITSELPGPLHLYTVYNECHMCPFTKEGTIDSGRMVISTRFEKTWRILSSPNETILCSFSPDFGEFGVYDLTIGSTCKLKTLKDPVNIYFPILTVVLIYALVALLSANFVYIFKVYTKPVERQTTSHDIDPKQCTQRSRVISLDTFRGITISLMILVNFGCGGYALFDHATWNGLQLADVVFPWFMWIMGVCLPISSQSMSKRGVKRKEALLGVLRRSCVLFGLGLFLGSGRNLDTLRIFGVLQRFGVCYLIVGTTFLAFPPLVNSDPPVEKKSVKMWMDVYALRHQWFVVFLLGVLHGMLSFFVHASNCARGYLGPGGLHDNGSHVGCTGGAAGYIDRLILGNHIYQGSVLREIYKGDAFEVEGILGCITSAIQVYLGSQAGATILFYKGHTSRLLRWMIWSTVLGLSGGFLCGFSREEGLIPLNKHLWSLSFVLVTSSLAFLALAICYVLVDVKRYWSGKPFLFAGMNAILMYVGHNLAFNNFPIRWSPNGDGFKTHFGTLFENVWGVAVWLLIAYLLFRRKFFLSI
ncbi:heparan-alpha-glucosaminide N-acetyltransferase isoform X2 [Photinus pyralis]|uniref:heparan-alpha-glucosaminide N-acetyltransferase isoform X2 n=1 Tax=Photinus pyralis TaxID=7054 RepID=UPI00126717E3|nr:heparan-alpha-glucosaminide N-acetyltransferase isoform X2 [Photinus pyralis]